MIDATPLLRAYAQWRQHQLAVEDPVLAQQQQLERLLRRARNTRFGLAHGFDKIRNVRQFQSRVPLYRYEEMWRDWWQPSFPRLENLSWPGVIPYFAASSGTTSGKTKYIPVSRDMLASNRRAVLDTFVHHIRTRRDSRILAGHNFMLGGSVDLVREAPGIFSGDLSGIAAHEVPWWARGRFFPPREVALIGDWEQKIGRVAPMSLQADIRSIAGTPSWMLLFFGRLLALRPNLPARSKSWYPNLELCIHGGVNFLPYKAQFESIFSGSHVDLREVYPASEGFVAVADRGSGDGLRLFADNGLFFEFVSVDEIDAAHPVRHWIDTVECGVNYAVVVSSNAGLWAYVLGDTLRFIDLHPPRVLITGRLTYSLSAFGEHLIGEEIEAAVAAAGRAIGRQAREYTVTAEFPSQPNGRGRHNFVVEFDNPVDEAGASHFAVTLDTALSEENADYRDHRAGMRPPEVTVVAPGSFAEWMRIRGRAGGQNKVPRVIADASLFSSLQDYMREGGRVVARSAEPFDQD